MENGSSVEVGMVGLEGMVSVSAMLGDKISKHHVVIQLPGVALKMNVTRCKEVFEQSPGFRREALHFASAFLAMNSQTSACNRLHSVEQRFARWLLMSADRFQSDNLPLTQDYIATMLGVRRPGVTETAGEFQKSSLIAYRKGKITIIDREGLEEASCECYANDRRQFEELMS
jgi:CRP-like cAMP-binding protein